MVHWSFLSPQEQDRLRRLVQVFIAEKHWEGCGGLEITDEIRVTVAGQACLLLLGFEEHDHYRNVSSIFVYPTTVVTPDRDGGLFVEEPMPILGEAHLRGPVVLVWDAVLHGSVHPERGHNVVYHEFAHKLDMLDGSADGTPLLASREEHARWVEVCTRIYEELQEESARGKRTFLDGYGATNVAEFFAVATEHFFNEPMALQRHHPELYAVLEGFYRQDTAARERRARRRRHEARRREKARRRRRR